MKIPVTSTALTARQAVTLRAVVDRVIPADEYPGGWDAGVGDYLERQFRRDLRDEVPLYRAGLDALNETAVARGGVDFASLDAAAQDEILSTLEKGTTAEGRPAESATFFRMLVEHAMEGYYSDPGNGGNRDAVSWGMIGFDVTDGTQ